MILDRLAGWDVAGVRGLTDFGSHHTWFLFLAYLAAEVIIVFFPFVLYALWRWPARTTRKYGNRKAVLLALLSIVFVLAVKTLVTFLIFRERPFVAYPDIAALPLKVDPSSFPSSHAMIAFAVAGSLWFSRIKPLAGWALVWAALVAFGRVAVGVHYPSDVIAGAFLGLATAWVIHHDSSALKHYLPDD